VLYGGDPTVALYLNDTTAQPYVRSFGSHHT
jgi:hypothetical protein